MKWNFEYGNARIKDFQVAAERDQRSGKVHVKSIELQGEKLTPTPRFWRSMFIRFGFSESVFRYFDHGEVFQRIAARTPSDTVRFCVERSEKGNPRLLSVSNPKRPVITHDEVIDLVDRYNGDDVDYSNGMITSTHRPRSGDCTFEIGGDHFKHRFVMETPIDGFSQPRIFLSFLRMVCSNGAIGYSRAFRSDVSLGKDIGHCISRALDSYDNGEGYAALRQRFESAQTSWASLHECNSLYKILCKFERSKSFSAESVMPDFHIMTGRLHELYGMANLDALSEKRQRILPAKCRIYDLVNFASEVATHHSDADANRSLQAYIGSLISDEYDMEGTAVESTEFADLLLGESAAALN
ncbi:DUF932 domain-containing protein [Blastopirellula sp. J2-11]|uniref:DUF932 domain-containing protein n=1 Tax=Blastopirellula sp. J2-11 TaxID=2943192 RepID=UPI0021C89754|nr:DUF932 domain-containing protein [Blastopirellula sp. J2-11]UUO05299.1 DUF932 domain-containing protein [Blastopirellula sp. J2-11]